MQNFEYVGKKASKFPVKDYLITGSFCFLFFVPQVCPRKGVTATQAQWTCQVFVGWAGGIVYQFFLGLEMDGWYDDIKIFSQAKFQDKVKMVGTKYQAPPQKRLFLGGALSFSCWLEVVIAGFWGTSWRGGWDWRAVLGIFG